MIIHQREFGYGPNYEEFFEALVKSKEYKETKYPSVSVELMYNLAGTRGRVTILTRYPSLADYEKIDAELDNDAEYMKLLEPTMGENAHPIIDQFYRVI